MTLDVIVISYLFDARCNCPVIFVGRLMQLHCPIYVTQDAIALPSICMMLDANALTSALDVKWVDLILIKQQISVLAS